MQQKLSPKQALFVREYLVDLNATQAAIRAGYTVKSAEVTGCKLLSIAKVKLAVQENAEKRIRRLGLSADETLERLSWIANSDPGDFFNEAGSLLNVKDLPEGVRKCIASIEVVKRNMVVGDGEMEYVHKIKWWDKVKALDLMSRYHKLINDKPETPLGGAQPIQILVQFTGNKTDIRAIPGQAAIPVSAASL